MSQVPEPIARQAMAWLLALQSPPVAERTLAGWQAWRQAAPEHERAWQCIEQFGERFAALQGHTRLTQSALGSAPLGRRQALKVLGLLAGAGGLGWAARSSRLGQDALADYHSPVGEQRRYTLADGSSVLLNTDTAIDVSITAQARGLRLLRGEVQLRSVADSRGPLALCTAQGKVEAMAACFSVRQGDGTSRVSVREGEVWVRPAAAAAQRLVAGQQLLFSSAQAGPPRALSEADQAWADGMIIADNQRLDAFLAELSRYRHGHLGCAAALAGLRVSGTYPLADTERVLASVSRLLGVGIRRFTPWWVSLEPMQAA
ncbi:FecR domain-containing protein [Pseudomonas sp. NPDC007930]|uniref:FecR domain-containing protein n=1 Tax=Pseudomonas sp. NPDC007930 TaxID=3364417 RepID=UPI0036F0108C